MDLKRATTLASVTVMTFMLAGGFFVQVSMQTFLFPFSIGLKVRMQTWKPNLHSLSIFR